MTPEQKQDSTRRKIQAVATLCNQLQLIPIAKQVMSPEGHIEMQVFYQDIERYPEEPKKEEKPEPKKVTNKKKNVKS